MPCHTALRWCVAACAQGKAMDKAPAALQQPYLRVVSLQEEAGDSHSRFNFSWV